MRELRLEEGDRRAWAPAFVRVDTIRCKQIRRRTVTSFITWRPSSETDASAFRRGWDYGAPRLVPPPATRRAPRLPPPPVPQRIGTALVPRGNATALSASGTHGSSGEEATHIQSTCPPPNSRLAEEIMVPAGHGHEHQGASPAASPGRSLDRDTTTESILASPAPRSEPASRRASVPADPALTRFAFYGSDMATGGAARDRRLLEDFAWSTWTIVSRSTQWKAYLELYGHEGRAIVPVNEGQLVAYVGWLVIEREAGRRSVSAASLPQYILAVRVVEKAFFDGQEALNADRMPILQDLLRA
jgi:hypothetical protein